jgi:hypothetical protein
MELLVPRWFTDVVLRGHPIRVRITTTTAKVTYILAWVIVGLGLNVLLLRLGVTG